MAKKFRLLAPQVELRARCDEYRKFWVEHSYLEGEIPVRNGIAECQLPETAEYLKSLGYTPIEEASPELLKDLGLKVDRVSRESLNEVW